MKLLPALCLASLSLGSAAVANRNGSGYTNCNNCHSGGTVPATQEISLPSLTVAPGDMVPVEVRFSGSKGGFAMQASGGTLTNADGSSKIVGAALTHTDRVNATTGLGGSLVRFAVNWKAPSVPGTYTLEAWCNSVNGNNQQTGDKAAVASATVTVAVGGGGAQDAGHPVVDAGSPEQPDAGSAAEPDAGEPEVDAGSPGAGGTDAGTAADGGTGNSDEPTGGCSAVGGSGLGVLALLALSAASRKRVSP